MNNKIIEKLVFIQFSSVTKNEKHEHPLNAKVTLNSKPEHKWTHISQMILYFINVYVYTIIVQNSPASYTYSYKYSHVFNICITTIFVVFACKIHRTQYAFGICLRYFLAKIKCKWKVKARGIWLNWERERERGKIKR